MRCAFVLAVSSVLVHAGCLAAIINVDSSSCSLAQVESWPGDKSDSQLIWAINDLVQTKEPAFKIQIEGEGGEEEADRNVLAAEPGREYEMVLRSMEAALPAERFLIWAQEEGKDHSGCGYGRLRSASDRSQHLTYDCPRFLVERSRESGGGQHSQVPFTWEAPRCRAGGGGGGCVRISALVLTGDSEFFTPEDDPHRALSITACVQDQEEEEEEKDVPEEDVLEETPGHHRRRLERQKLRTTGRKRCCREGIMAMEVTKTAEVCADVPAACMAESVANFDVPVERCAIIYAECCRNHNRMKKYKRKLDEARQELARFYGEETQQQLAYPPSII